MNRQMRISNSVQRVISAMGSPQSHFLRMVVSDAPEEHPYIQSNLVIKAPHEDIMAWPDPCKVNMTIGAIRILDCVVVVSLIAVPNPRELIMENYWNYWASPEHQKIFDDLSIQDRMKYIVFDAESNQYMRTIEVRNWHRQFFLETIKLISNHRKWSFDEFQTAKEYMTNHYTLAELRSMLLDAKAKKS